MKAQVNFDSLGGSDISGTVTEGIFVYYEDPYLKRVCFKDSYMSTGAITVNTSWNDGEYIQWNYGSSSGTVTIKKACKGMLIAQDGSITISDYSVGDSFTLVTYPPSTKYTEGFYVIEP